MGKLAVRRPSPVTWHLPKSLGITPQSLQRYGRHTQSPSRAVPHGTQLRMLRRCCGATVPRQGDAWLPHVQNLEQLGPLSKRRLRKREWASFQAHGQSRLCVTRSWSPNPSINSSLLLSLSSSTLSAEREHASRRPKVSY